MKFTSIDIHGTIDESTVMQVKDILMNPERDRNAPVIVSIYSLGGSPLAGYSIASLLKWECERSKLWTVNLGDVSSAAIDIYMTGGRRYALPTSVFMIHQARLTGKNVRGQGIKNLATDWGIEKKALENLFRTLKLTKHQKSIILQGHDLELYYHDAVKAGLVISGGLPW